jgi:hypothetical protein
MNDVSATDDDTYLFRDGATCEKKKKEEKAKEKTKMTTDVDNFFLSFFVFYSA